jgi:hypothetical protein
MNALPTTDHSRKGYCIYTDTLCQGPVPVVSDEAGYVVFESELEAQREIVDFMMVRLQQFLHGERDFEDAIHVEEYVVAVAIGPDGAITAQHGRTFEPISC